MEDLLSTESLAASGSSVGMTCCRSLLWSALAVQSKTVLLCKEAVVQGWTRCGGFELRFLCGAQILDLVFHL